MQDSSIEYLPLEGQCSVRASLARGPKGCWSTGYWSLRLGPPPSSAQRFGVGGSPLLYAWFGDGWSAAGVDFNPGDFYMRDMNRDGASNVDCESDAESCDSDGKDNYGNEQQRQGTSCKSFERFHQIGCAAGF